MNQIRHDLLTSGWSMVDCRKYLDRFNQNWQEAPYLEYRYWGLFPQVYKDFVGEMDWLLHEALPEENFKARTILAISDWIDPHHSWHKDYAYLRVLFTPRGEGTHVARSFENNLVTPYGYALIMSGTNRQYRTKIPATYHSSPENAWERRLLVADFS